MRILLAVPVPPQADGGGAIPVLLDAELRGLRQRHEVTLVTAVGDEPGEEEAVARLREEGEVHVADRRRPPPGGRRRRRQLRMATAWARGRWPWRTVWYADPGIQAILDRLGTEREFDVVAVEDSAMSVFRYPAGVATVYTHHEVLRSRPVTWNPGPPRRWPGWAFGELDWRRWERFQRQAWRQFDLVQVFSRRDAETVAELAPDVAARVRVDPFGLALPPRADPAREVAGTILFVGAFHHPPNRDAAIWLAHEILPAVLRRAPGARLRIVGSAPPPEVLALAGPRVEVVADAPRVQPHTEAAAVVMAPVRTGGGMRMKVLQAMAAGKAVVTTPRGTEGYTGFGTEPPLAVAEGTAEIAAATAALLEDDAARRSLGERAREFAERHHSPEAWAERQTAVFEEAREARRRGRMAEGPSVTVVIPTHQRREALRTVLDSLSRQSVGPDEYEVVVSVDASTDGTVEMLEGWEGPLRLRHVSPDTRGRAAACNAAVAAARGEVTIVLDDDMRVVPEFVERHRAHHPAGSRRCVLGAVPVELGPGSTHAARYVKDKFDLHLSRLSDPAHLALPRSFFTGNASLRTETMCSVGGFDDSFGIYGNEDVELALRLRGSGVELGYDPEALAWQAYDKDLGGLQRDTLAKGRTTVQLARSHREVFGDLRLASPDEASRPWLAARAVLLWATRRLPATSGVVFALFSLLEGLGAWRLPLFYRPVLDYAFWAGVDAALRESNDEGDLSNLAGELQRGPIDLLLHR